MWDLLPYYIYFAFIFFLYGNMKTSATRELQQKTVRVQFLFFVMLALWLLIGMRDESYGRDTLSYILSFRDATSFKGGDSVEPGFQLLEYVIRSITDNYHVFLMCSSLVISVSMYKIMKRYFTYSYQIIAAICIYVLLGILAFDMAAIRQAIAVSIGILSFMYASDGKWKQFLICVALAYTFHNSSFVLLALYPLRYLNTKKYGVIGVAVVFLIGFIAPTTVVPFLQTYLPMEDRFAAYGTVYESSQNYTGFFLQLILVVVAYLKRDQIELDQKTKNMFFNAAYIGLAIQSLTGTLAELYRVSFYFCIFDMILIPMALMTFKGPQARTIRICFIMGALFYIFVLSGGGVLPLKQIYNNGWSY